MIILNTCVCPELFIPKGVFLPAIARYGMMSKKHFFILVIITSLFVACKHSSSALAGNEKKGVFTPGEWDLMQAADSVKLFRLRELNRYTPMAVPGYMYEQVEFTFEGEGKLQREFYYEKARLMTAQEIQDLFPFISQQNKTNTAYQYQGKCRYEPGAGIKFYKGGQRFYLLLCFNCNVWAFERNKVMYYVDFDQNQRTALVKYAKQLFPSDIEFQGLKE